MLTLLTVCAIL